MHYFIIRNMFLCVTVCTSLYFKIHVPKKPQLIFVPGGNISHIAESFESMALLLVLILIFLRLFVLLLLL